MSDGVRVTVAADLRPEAVDGFHEGFHVILEDTAKAKGCREVIVVSHKDDRSKILFIEQWDREEDFWAYIAWRTERGDIDYVNSILVEPWKIDVWPNEVAKV